MMQIVQDRSVASETRGQGWLSMKLEEEVVKRSVCLYHGAPLHHFPIDIDGHSVVGISVLLELEITTIKRSELGVAC